MLDQVLVDASNFEERKSCEYNDTWATKRVKTFWEQLGWDMKVALGDLQLEKSDELSSTMFAKVVKIRCEHISWCNYDIHEWF